MASNKRNDDTALGCVVCAIISVLIMPIAGLVLVCNQNPEKKNLGWILLGIGIVLWIGIAFI